MTIAWWILFAALIVASVAYVVTWFQLHQFYRELSQAQEAQEKVLEYKYINPPESAAIGGQ